MNYLRWLIASLVLVSGVGTLADESWLEGSWVASKEHTVEALAQGHPAPKKALEESPLEVEGRWTFKSGTIQIERKDSTLERTNYHIRPIEQGIFELLFETPNGKQNYVIIHKTVFGFCYRYGGDYSHPPSPKPNFQCYVPADA